MAAKRPGKKAPKGRFRVIGFDFYKPAEYGPAEWKVKDCKTLNEAKKLARDKDHPWGAARVYDDNGREVFKTATADLI